MASPLTTIRKYDKVLLAVFGVLLMISFLVADPLSFLTGAKGGGGGGGGQSHYAVTFKGGGLTNEQLQRMHRADSLCDQLLMEVAREAQILNAQPHMFPEHEDPRFAQFMPPEPRTESRLMRNRLLALKAHELGLSLSNDDIDDLINRMSNDSVGKPEIKKMRQKLLEENANSTIHITERDLYAQFRINFLAQELLAMVRNSTDPMRFERMGFVSPRAMTLPPAEAWELFRRTARLAKVELLPLEVEQFVASVKSVPTAAQKDKLYADFKDNVAAPFSPDPGFARPHKIGFGYVRIDFQPFLDKAMAEVTDEAIRADYDKKLEAGELTVPLEKKKDGETSDPDKSNPDDKQPEDKTPSDEDKEKGDQPDQENPDKKQPEKKESGDEPPPKNDDQDELKDQDENDEAQEPAADAGDEGASDDKPEAKKPGDDDKPADEKPADEKNPDEKESTDKPAKKKEKEKVQTRDKTYEEMEPEIRKQLAQKPAQDAQREAVDELYKALDEYKSQYRGWEYEKETAAADKSKAKEVPPQPDLLKILGPVLKKHGFEYRQTALKDQFEIANEELGKAQISVGNGQQVPVAAIYDSQLNLYEPVTASEGFLRDTTYLLWKETDQPQQTPTRKEVDEELTKAVKLQDAYKDARIEAERLAGQARAKGDESLLKSLGPVDKAAAVVTTRPFSWLTTGFAPGGMGMRLQPTELPEAPYVGEEFMQMVLDLQPGEVGVAADQPHKRVYVIRMIEQSPEEDVLREMFLAKGVNDRNVSQQFNAERLATVESWVANVLLKEYQLKWNRNPTQFGR
jgi:hypothetical protein